MEPADPSTRPLNALQRRYFAWAEPWYQRMAPDLREQARRIDTFLYSRAGLTLWLAVVLAVAGSAAALVAAGFPWPAALACSVAVWVALIGASLSAWLQPDRHTAGRLLGIGVGVTVTAFAGALTGFLVARATHHGARRPEDFLDPLADAMARAAPVLLLGAVALVVMMSAVARLRRGQMARELERLRVRQALDAAARQAAEARLAALRAQVQPHFIFNTLAALQHWVDEADPRAGPLLRSLTGFLRGSTELLARERATLGDELPLVEHYLAVMHTRWGARLAGSVQADAASLQVPLPPGLLLTLVENAVEHGAGSRLQDGQVQVRARCAAGRCLLEVQDNGPGLAPGWREGIGLANARERLAHHGGGRAVLRLLDAPEGGCLAQVELPLSDP